MGNIADINKVGGLCIRDKKLLVVKSKGQDVYFALGGKLEQDETELECLKREVKEEVSCQIKDPEHYGIFEGKAHTPNKTIQMTCYLCELEGELGPSSEIEEIAWIDRNYKEKDIKLAGLLELHIVPHLIKQGLL